MLSLGRNTKISPDISVKRKFCHNVYVYSCILFCKIVLNLCWVTQNLVKIKVENTKSFKAIRKKIVVGKICLTFNRTHFCNVPLVCRLVVRSVVPLCFCPGNLFVIMQRWKEAIAIMLVPPPPSSLLYLFYYIFTCIKRLLGAPSL